MKEKLFASQNRIACISLFLIERFHLDNFDIFDRYSVDIKTFDGVMHILQHRLKYSYNDDNEIIDGIKYYKIYSKSCDTIFLLSLEKHFDLLKKISYFILDRTKKINDFRIESFYDVDDMRYKLGIINDKSKYFEAIISILERKYKKLDKVRNWFILDNYFKNLKNINSVNDLEQKWPKKFPSFLKNEFKRSKIVSDYSIDSYECFYKFCKNQIRLRINLVYEIDNTRLYLGSLELHPDEFEHLDKLNYIKKHMAYFENIEQNNKLKNLVNWKDVVFSPQNPGSLVHNYFKAIDSITTSALTESESNY